MLQEATQETLTVGARGTPHPLFNTFWELCNFSTTHSLHLTKRNPLGFREKAAHASGKLEKRCGACQLTQCMLPHLYPSCSSIKDSAGTQEITLPPLVPLMEALGTAGPQAVTPAWTPGCLQKLTLTNAGPVDAKERAALHSSGNPPGQETQEPWHHPNLMEAE